MAVPPSPALAHTRFMGTMEGDSVRGVIVGVEVAVALEDWLVDPVRLDVPLEEELPVCVLLGLAVAVDV